MRNLILFSAIGLTLMLTSPEAKAVKVGDQAPCVVLTNIAPNGTESDHCIRDTKFPGQAKILEFFSATCSDCAKNLPIVSALADRLERNATTRLVGIDRDEKLLRDYTTRHRDQIHFEVALDTARDAKRAYDVIETPTVFVLNSKDKVIYRHSGVLSQSDVATIEKLVESSN